MEDAVGAVDDAELCVGGGPEDDNEDGAYNAAALAASAAYAINSGQWGYLNLNLFTLVITSFIHYYYYARVLAGTNARARIEVLLCVECLQAGIFIYTYTLVCCGIVFSGLGIWISLLFLG